MARNIETEIKEEEEYEAEDAQDVLEQENPKEYGDDAGENTSPKAAGRHAGVLYECLKCGERKHAGKEPVCCGYKMIPVDYEGNVPTKPKAKLVVKLVETSKPAAKKRK